MPDTVLVTGAAGFLGSTLVDRLLAEGRRVVGVDDLSGGSLANLAEARADHPGAFEFHRLDVAGEALDAIVARHRPQVLFHLAAPAHGAGRSGDPVREATVRVLGTVRLLEAARRHGARKVVLALGVEARDADAPGAAGQAAAFAYARSLGAANDIAVTTLFLSEAYGPRQPADRLVGRLLGDQLAGSPCTIHGDPDRACDLLYVDDAVDALARSVGRGDGAEVTVGSGTATTVRALHDALAAATGTRHTPVAAPGRPGDRPVGPVDVGPAREVLGWVPFTPLDEGLANTLRWAASP